MNLLKEAMKEHFLTILRDRDSDLSQFRLATQNLGSLIAAEVSQQVHLEKKQVLTPLAAADGARLSQTICLVCILRAGLTLLPPFAQLFPQAPIGLFGIRRDEKTAKPHLYYEKLPSLTHSDLIFLLDPMLATGGTANLALDQLKAKGASASQIRLITILAAPEGMVAVKQRHGEVSIYTVSVEEKLNDRKFIVPGVGDFGDRYFGN